MKIIKSTLALILVLSVVSTFSMAADRTTDKAREAVENSSPDDWYTLAKSAEDCMKKNVNLKEACEWLDKSLAIAENAYNLTLKGDYYQMNKLPEKALECYVKAISAAKEENNNVDVTDIQKKIAKLANIGG